MKSKTQLGIVRHSFAAGILMVSLAAFAENTTYTLTRDAIPREYNAKYLAQRLGVAERSSKLIGLPVRDQGGHKLGKLQDCVLDLNSGRILCVLVGNGEPAGPALVPARSFHAHDTSGATLDLIKPSFADAPRSAAGVEQPAFLNSLRQSYAWFNQKSQLDETGSPQPAKVGELIGANVRNGAGEALGKVIDLVADLPTARVVFAVVSFKGGANDLYLVPPTALQLIAGEHALLLNADKAKVASLAKSDGFFWSSLAESGVGVAAYRNFGLTADFDEEAAPNIEAAKEEVRAKVEPAAPQKSDAELQRDMLTALMHDDVNNTFVYKNVRLLATNGQVTLTGKVKNEKQKAKLVAIVASVAGSTNIHDQTEIK